MEYSISGGGKAMNYKSFWNKEEATEFARKVGGTVCWDWACGLWIVEWKIPETS